MLSWHSAQTPVQCLTPLAQGKPAPPNPILCRCSAEPWEPRTPQYLGSQPDQVLMWKCSNWFPTSSCSGVCERPGFFQ